MSGRRRRNKPIRRCCVKDCPSSELDKIMINAPNDEPRHTSWEKAVGTALRSKGKECICEDHFQLEEDAENWIKYKLMPGTRLVLKKTAIPHRFGINNSQSQFPGYIDRFMTESSQKSSLNKKKPKKKPTKKPTENQEHGAIRFPEPSHIATPFVGVGGQRMVPCTCEAGKMYHDIDATTGTDDEDNLVHEPEVTIKEEPEENFDFPLVLVKEEPFWDGMGTENSNFTTNEDPPDEEPYRSPYEISGMELGRDNQHPDICVFHGQTTSQVADTYKTSTTKAVLSGKSRTGSNRNGRPINRNRSFGRVEVDSSSGESARSYLSSPSSPPTPVDDSDADPEYNIDCERRLKESTDDDEDEEECEPRKRIPEGSDSIYICYWCNKKFRLRVWMKSHMYKKHSGEKPYACNKCDYRAAHPSNLRNHKYAQHSAKRRFVCDVCNQRYATRNGLRSHKSHVHQREKRFGCDTCDFRTNYSEKIKMHIMRHTGEKPHSCKFCGAKFTHRNAMKTHTLIHTGEKPYACDRCDYRCRQSGMLTAHKRVHHPEESDSDS